MNSQNPLVTVIITAYNTETYVKQAIESVVGQTYQPLEIIVVDDGSTDQTGVIARSFGDKILYVRQENKGESGARNTGVRQATGEYISFLDADDYYMPEKIEKEVRFAQAHPEYKVVYCGMMHFFESNPNVFYEHQGIHPSGDVLEKLLHSFFGQADTLLIHRSVFDKVGLPPEDEYRYSIDREMNIRMARGGFQFGFLNEPLVKYRIMETSQSSLENQWKCKDCDLRIMQDIFATMSAAELEKYHAKKILFRLKVRRFVASLLKRNTPWLIRTIVTKLFTYNRRKLLKRIN